MKFDLHTHHERCGHASGTIEDYIKAAIRAELQVIGISDHSPFFAREGDHSSPGIAMAISMFPEYVAEVLSLKQKYAGKIEVLLGMESDYFPAVIDVYRKAFEHVPFDYIIGSVHLSGGASIFNKTRWQGLTLAQKIVQKEEYYRLVQGSATCGLFHVLGHIDAMKGYYPEFSEIPTDIIEETLRIVGEHGLAVEVNTSGKTKWSGGWYPSDEILERAFFYDVDITLGSDSHIPERVGDDFDLVGAKLKEIGYKDWVFFRNKHKVRIEL